MASAQQQRVRKSEHDVGGRFRKPYSYGNVQEYPTTAMYEETKNLKADTGWPATLTEEWLI